MQHIFLTLATVVLAGSIFAALAAPLQMLQQNSYFNRRYLFYLRTAFSWRSALAGICTGVLALLLWWGGWSGRWFLIFSVVCAVVRTVDVLKRQKKAIKPLVVTARVIRMYVTAGVLLALGCMAVALLPISKWLIFIACLAWLFTPLTVLAVNLINRPVEKLVARYYINDAKKMLAAHRSLRVVGITGSYGKTSTKYILGRLLAEKYNVLITPGSYNTPMGVVRTIREHLLPTTEVFVCEMGAKQVGDIREICEICPPEMGIITSVGPQHLNTFGSMENIVKTKFELADAVVAKKGPLFLNVENDLIRQKHQEIPSVGYGLTPQADVYADEITTGRTGSSFTIHAGERSVSVHTRLLGAHAVLNITAAVAVAMELGLTDAEIKIAVAQLMPVEHRLEMKSFLNHSILIDDAYNANPEGSLEAVRVLGSFEGMHKIIVTPGLVELGEKEYECNHALGVAAAGVCDEIILVGQQRSVPLADGAKSAGYPEEKIKVVASFQEALQILRSVANRDTVVLIENDLPDNYAR